MGKREHGAGVLVNDGVMRGPLGPHSFSIWPIFCPSLSGAPPNPGPRSRHVGRPRTRLGPLPHWLPAQLPASPWGLGKSPLFTPCCGVSCKGGAGWGWRGPTFYACVPARLPPDLGPCCSGPMGLPLSASPILHRPLRGLEEGSTKNLGQSWQGVQGMEGGCAIRI